MPGLWKIISSNGRSDAGRTLTLDGRIWPVRIIRNARARRLTLRFDGIAGEVRLTVPHGASIDRALAWAGEQRAFLRRQINATGAAVMVGAGTIVPYMGEGVTIVWDGDRPRAPCLDGDRLIVGGAADTVGRRVGRWLRAEALAVLTDETWHYTAIAGLRAGRVAVADPKSRWGSCASDATIRYSWRLILAPDEVRRATVAHEVAHLRHMHHGPDFHALVDEIFEGNARHARRWLRANGAGLHRYRFD